MPGVNFGNMYLWWNYQTIIHTHHCAHISTEETSVEAAGPPCHYMLCHQPWAKCALRTIRITSRLMLSSCAFHSTQECVTTFKFKVIFQWVMHTYWTKVEGFFISTVSLDLKRSSHEILLSVFTMCICTVAIKCFILLVSFFIVQMMFGVSVI